MKVYVVVLNDRHSDTEVSVHSDRENAINTARRTAKHLCMSESFYEEVEYEAWEFYALYSSEGDNIFVVKKEVKE